MFDVEGNKYIDFLSCAGSLNYGHNPPAIKNALVEYLQDDGIQGALDLHTDAKARFIRSFRDIILAPRNMNHRLQFTAPTGTSVVESAVKLARKVTGRPTIVSFTNGFHGMTGTSLGLTGQTYHRQAIQDSHVARMPFEGYLGEEVDTISYMKKLFNDPSSGIDKPAAVIVETIQGEGGVNVASSKWLQDLRALTSEQGILLIIDDIQAGCGRAGSFFSFEASGIEPDLICLSKSISGFALPMSLLLIKPEYDCWSPAEDNGTFRGNTLAFVAAHTALNEYWSNPALQQAVVRKGEMILGALRSIESDHPGEIKAVRGRGMFCGIEFFDADLAKTVADLCFDASLIVERCGPGDEVIKLFPALTIDAPTLNRGLEIIRDAIQHAARSRRRGEHH